TGLGAGLPLVGGQPPIPAVHTDFPFAALGEELGLVGVLAILGLYLVVIERGLRIAAAAADDFRALLAAGLALVVGVQAFIIAAGNLKLIPLTGITLPVISYGGSSILANAVVVGLLLALSRRDANGEPYRVYTDPSMSPVIGYASRFFGTAGLEHTYDAQLTGVLSPDPVQQLLAKFQGNRADPQDLTLTISLRLQRAAQKALGND